MSRPLPRAPIRTTTFDHEGWMRAQQQRQASELEVLSEGVVEHAICPPPPKASPPSILLAQTRWQTDIVTFCSQIRHDPLLRRAQVTEIQNRKSKRLPYLQEYLLLFFSVGQRRFVAHIDYPRHAIPSAKQAHPEADALLSNLGGQATSRQQVIVFHVAQEEETTPWFEDDGRGGSELVAALTTWADLGSAGTTFVSHHLSTTREASYGRPSLQDVCRLIEAVVLESSTCHFKTVSGFVNARSSLLVVYNCFPHDFACQLGQDRELVPASGLEEPAWSSLLRWYLPFTLVALTLYTVAIIGLHIWVAHLLDSNTASKPSIGSRVGVLEAAEKCMLDPTAPECVLPGVSTAVWKNALRLMLHVILDLPFPVGLLHTWLTSTEMQMAGLVRRISRRFLDDEPDTGDDGMTVKTWLGTCSKPWFDFVVSAAIGCLIGLVLFVGILLGHGMIALILFVICVAVVVNRMLPPMDTGLELSESPEDGLPLLDCELSFVPDPSMAGPSSSRI